MDWLAANPWILRLGLVVAGVLAGILIERFLVGTFRALAKRTESTWDDLLIGALRGMPLVWCTAAGIWAATGVGSLSETLRTRINQVLQVAVIVSFTLIAMRLASGAVERIPSRDKDRLPSTSLVSNLVNLVIGTIGLFLILQNLDIQITPLLTALGIGGLAVALALQDTLGNLFAGVSIIVAGQVRTGDYIRMDSGEEGFVTDVKARNTTIRTFPDNNLVVIPNSVLASRVVTNYSLPRRALLVAVPVGVAYDSDLQHVERVTVEVAKEVLERVEKQHADAEPVVRYQEFGDSSINFNVLLPASRFRNQFLIKHEFIKALHARFNREGIEIPFPIRTVYMRNPGPPSG